MPIEFVAEEPDEPAEPDAGQSGRPRPRRAALYRVAAAALVAVAVIVWALTRPSGTPTNNAAQPTNSPSVLTPTAARSSGPATLTCEVDAPVTISIAAAMKRYLPALDLANLNVYQCTSGGTMGARIVFEAISGRFHQLNIDVEAALRTDGTQAASPRLGSDGGRYVIVARIEALAAGMKVDVTAWGKRGARAPIDAMRNLADFVSLNVVL